MKIKRVFQVKYEGVSTVFTLEYRPGRINFTLTYSDLVDMIREKFRISAAPEMLQVTYSKGDEQDTMFLINDDGDLYDACWTQALNPLFINVNLRGTTDTHQASIYTDQSQPRTQAGDDNMHTQPRSVYVHCTNGEETKESCVHKGCAYAATVELPDGDIEVLVSLVTPENQGRPVPHWRLVAPAGPKLSGHRVRLSIQVVPKDDQSVELSDPVSTQ